MPGLVWKWQCSYGACPTPDAVDVTDTAIVPAGWSYDGAHEMHEACRTASEVIAVG